MNTNNKNILSKGEHNNITILGSFQPKLNSIKSYPISSLVIIADYDDTFTTAYINGNIKSRTSFGVIDSSTLMSFEYTSKAKSLGDKYRPYENDLSINLPDRIKKMDEWYNFGLQYMAEEHLSKDLLEKLIDEAVKDKHILFRNKTDEFFEMIISLQIPLIIISAGIKEVIKGEFKALSKHYYDTMINKGLLHIIANEFTYDDNEKVCDYCKPAITTFNKSIFINKEINTLNNAKEKVNIIFLGDHLNDIDSIKDLKYENVLSVAFYNKKNDVPIDYYNKYNAIVKNDGDFQLINAIINELK